MGSLQAKANSSQYPSELDDDAHQLPHSTSSKNSPEWKDFPEDCPPEVGWDQLIDTKGGSNQELTQLQRPYGTASAVHEHYATGAAAPLVQPAVPQLPLPSQQYGNSPHAMPPHLSAQRVVTQGAPLVRAPTHPRSMAETTSEREAQSSDASGTTKTRSRVGDPRTLCICTCGCRKTYYEHKRAANIQCPLCKKNTNGNCGVPRKRPTQPSSSPAANGRATRRHTIVSQPQARFPMTEHQAPRMPSGTSGPNMYSPVNGLPNTMPQGNDQHVQSPFGGLPNTTFFGNDPNRSATDAVHASTRNGVETISFQTFMQRYGAGVAAATPDATIHQRNSNAQRTMQHQATPQNSAAYMEVFSDQAAVEAYFEGKEQTEYTPLPIVDDDVDTVTEQQKRDLCKAIFNALLDDPSPASTGLNAAEVSIYNQRQVEAMKQCKTRMGNENSKRVSACCDKVYYTAVRLHKQGLPKHTGGYTKDWTSKLTVRMAHIIAAVSSNKRVAYDVLPGQRLDDLVCGPKSFTTRKLQNSKGNGRKSTMLKAVAQKMKQEHVAAEVSSQSVGETTLSTSGADGTAQQQSTEDDSTVTADLVSDYAAADEGSRSSAQPSSTSRLKRKHLRDNDGDGGRGAKEGKYNTSHISKEQDGELDQESDG